MSTFGNPLAHFVFEDGTEAMYSSSEESSSGEEEEEEEEEEETAVSMTTAATATVSRPKTIKPWVPPSSQSSHPPPAPAPMGSAATSMEDEEPMNAEFAAILAKVQQQARGGGDEDSSDEEQEVVSSSLTPDMPEEWGLQMWSGLLDHKTDAAFEIVLGPSGAGKSFTIFWQLLTNKSKYKRVIYMSDEATTRADARKWLPSLDVMRFSDEKVWRIIKFQSEMKEAGMKPPWQCLVIDDCTNNEWANGKKKCSAVVALAQYTRHLNLDVIWAGQKMSNLTTFIRNNAHIVLTGFLDVDRERKALQREYFSGHPWFSDTAQGKRQFEHVFRAVCCRPADGSVKARKMLVALRQDASAAPENKVAICAPTFPPEFFRPDGTLNFDMYRGCISSRGFWLKSMKHGIHAGARAKRLKENFMQRIIAMQMAKNSGRGKEMEEKKYEIVEKEDAPVMQTFRKGQMVREGKPLVRRKKKKKKDGDAGAASKALKAAAAPPTSWKPPKVTTVKKAPAKSMGLATMFGGATTMTS